MAEIAFLIKLSRNNKIPALFGTGTSVYWAAGKEVYHESGEFFDFSSTTPSSTGNYTRSSITYKTYVRCVYDAWYWGDKTYPGYNAGDILDYKTTR